jgi:hypothetical protein
MIQMPGFSPFWQLAWVTPDLERSMEQFRTIHKVPSFYVMEPVFDAVLNGEQGSMAIRMALANVDDYQLELIQPLGEGIVRLYTDALPGDGSHANVFHHVCTRIRGTLEDWDNHLASLPPERPICYTGDAPDGIRFAYTDDRASCGIYGEHIWYDDAVWEALKPMIPHFYSK